MAPLFLLLLMIPTSNAFLDVNYYDQTCPNAEKIITDTVHNASVFDPKVPPRLLRMFFHDCFIRVNMHPIYTYPMDIHKRNFKHVVFMIMQGCDGSVLVDSTPGNQAEKDGPPNLSLGAFNVIDEAKRELEKACPRTVSCADIIAIAARDVVAISGGPYWSVLKGRKDGTVSRANETINLPAPSFNVTQLIQSFLQRGLSVKDMVALSGGHTLGFSHCSSFESRLRNFSPSRETDPIMNQEFAESLKKKCPKPNNDGNAGQFLDSTAATFDNNYYKQIVVGKGVFGTDQALYNDYRTKWLVEMFAEDQTLFFEEFVASMVTLGNVGINEEGEVRVKCRVVN